MAERRMISKTIVDSDAFLEMPTSTQNLYFHLNIRADDEGFVNAPKKIMRMIGANDDDLKILLTKRYLLGFESGIIVVKHWKIHNLIRSDRMKETLYTEEKAMLYVKPDGAYTDCQPDDNQLPTKCPSSIGKDSIEEVSKVELSEVEIVGQKSEIVFNELQEKFLKFLCDKFGVTEQRFPQNYMLIHRAITKKITEGEYEWFSGQCYFYFKYKEHEEEKVHSLKTFIGDIDNMSTGGWNNENWDKKYQSVKKTPKPAHHVQPNRRQPGKKRSGTPQTIKSIRK